MYFRKDSRSTLLVPALVAVGVLVLVLVFGWPSWFLWALLGPLGAVALMIDWGKLIADRINEATMADQLRMATVQEFEFEVFARGLVRRLGPKASQISKTVYTTRNRLHGIEIVRNRQGFYSHIKVWGSGGEHFLAVRGQSDQVYYEVYDGGNELLGTFSGPNVDLSILWQAVNSLEERDFPGIDLTAAQVDSRVLDRIRQYLR